LIVLFRAVVVTYTSAENDHLVGHDLGSEVSLAVVVLPTPGLEPTLNVDLLSSGEMLIANLRFPQATTLNHSVSSRRSPSDETQERLEAILKDVTGLPLGVYLISGLRPRLPISITLLSPRPISPIPPSPFTLGALS
jgi:hypothetical protein